MAKSNRKIHSSIDKLPAALQDALRSMVIDDAWPADFRGETEGKPTLDDMVAYCSQQGQPVARSSIHRYSMQMRALSRMRAMGLLVGEVMKDMTGEKAVDTQKAAAQMITAILIEAMSRSDTLSPKDIANIAKAIKDASAVAIQSDKYIRDQHEIKAKAADKKITNIGRKEKISPEVLKLIREQIYGIVT